MSNVCAATVDNEDVVLAELEIDAELHPALVAALAGGGHNRAESVPSVWSEIGQAIDCARDWQDLSASCDHIDAAFNMGDLGPEQADSLIAAVVRRSRAIPEVAATSGSE